MSALEESTHRTATVSICKTATRSYCIPTGNPTARAQALMPVWSAPGADPDQEAEAVTVDHEFQIFNERLVYFIFACCNLGSSWRSSSDATNRHCLFTLQYNG